MKLYTVQTDQVLETLAQTGQCYVKRDYVTQKYGESASVFLHAYSWYAAYASRIVPRPPEAETAVWTFCQPDYLECHPGSHLLSLEVPLSCCVFFRMGDWNKILNLRYLGKDRKEEVAFAEKLARQGVSYEGDVVTTPFYPVLKRELLESWQNLFSYDAAVKTGEIVPYPDMQAGLWCLKQEWVESDK